MRRQISLALGALGFTLLGQLAQAAEPIYYSPSRYSSSVVQVQGTDDLGSAPASAAVEAMTGSHGHHGGGCDRGCGQHKLFGTHRCVGGVGFYYIRPSWETNPAFSVSRTDLVSPGSPSTFTEHDFDWDYEVAPLVWLGLVTDNGAGIRTRYWRLDTDASDGITNDSVAGVTSVFISTPSVGFLSLSASTPGDRLDVESTLELDVWDLELTKEFESCGCTFLLAGGFRSARVEQTYSATVTSLIGDIDSLFSERTIRGLGVTVAMEVRKAVDFCPGLALYGSARGSLLCGRDKQEVERIDMFAGVVFDADANTLERDDVLRVVELEAGGEYACDLGCHRLLFQAAVVSQTWYGIGDGRNSFEDDPGGGDSFSRANNNSDLGLFGLKASVGLQY
jgi:hypothetical protein